jgi:hypothetical protein
VLAVGEGRLELGSGVRLEVETSGKMLSAGVRLLVERASAAARGSRAGGSRTGVSRALERYRKPRWRRTRGVSLRETLLPCRLEQPGNDLFSERVQVLGSSGRKQVKECPSKHIDMCVL